jgi:disulfide bond formation protein DsbB
VQRENQIFQLMTIFSFGSVAVALISQHVYDMQPCAWCVFQRLLYLLIGGVALAVILTKPRRTSLFLGAASIAAIAVSGVTAAIYQEKVAANTFSCAQTLADQIMTKSGLDATLPWLFGIYASCMEARVKFLGVEYAWWSMAMFCLLGVLAIITILRLRR